jgi:hypothetical protein
MVLLKLQPHFMATMNVLWFKCAAHEKRHPVDTKTKAKIQQNTIAPFSQYLRFAINCTSFPLACLGDKVTADVLAKHLFDVDIMNSFYTFIVNRKINETGSGYKANSRTNKGIKILLRYKNVNRATDSIHKSI